MVPLLTLFQTSLFNEFTGALEVFLHDSISGLLCLESGLILEIRKMKQEGPGSCNVIIRLIMGKPSLRKVKDGRSMLFA